MALINAILKYVIFFLFPKKLIFLSCYVYLVYADGGMILSEDGKARLDAIRSGISNHTGDINELMDVWDYDTMKVYGDQTITGKGSIMKILMTLSFLF